MKKDFSAVMSVEEKAGPSSGQHQKIICGIALVHDVGVGVDAPRLGSRENHIRI
jgi:hypothetical protein